MSAREHGKRQRESFADADQMSALPGPATESGEVVGEDIARVIEDAEPVGDGKRIPLDAESLAAFDVTSALPAVRRERTLWAALPQDELPPARSRVLLRHGRQADADRLRPVWNELWPERTLEPASFRALYRALLEDPNTRVWIALAGEGEDEAGDVIAGFAVCSWRPSVYDSGLMCALDAMAVARSHRRRGIATQLVQAVRATARVVGATGITLTSALHRRGAHRLYESLGFERTGYRFFKLEP